MGDEIICPLCGCKRHQHDARGCIHHSYCKITHMDPMWKKGQPKP